MSKVVLEFLVNGRAFDGKNMIVRGEFGGDFRVGETTIHWEDNCGTKKETVEKIKKMFGALPQYSTLTETVDLIERYAEREGLKNYKISYEVSK